MKRYILALICLVGIGQQSLSEPLPIPELKTSVEVKVEDKPKILNISIDEQIKDLESKITNDKNNSKYYYDRGILYYKKSNQVTDTNNAFKYINLSVKDFEQSIKINPNNSDTYLSLSFSMIKINSVLNNMLIELDKNFQKNKYMDKLANKRSLSRFGRAKLEKMGREYNNLLKNIKGLENTALMTKKYSLENIQKAEEINNSNPNVYNAYTYYYLSENDLVKANESIEKALSIEPRNHELYNTKAFVKLAEKNYKLAEEYFKTALELSPNNQDYLINLSSLYLQNKENDKLFDNLSKFIELEPNNEIINKLFISGLENIPNNKNREEKINLILNNIRYKNNYKNLISDSYILMANFEKDQKKSINYLKIALENKNENIKAKSLLVKKYIEIANKETDLNKKINILEKASSENPLNNNVILELAKNYKINKNYDKSIEKYKYLISNNQINADYYYQLALLYALKKDKINTFNNLNKAFVMDKKYKKMYKKEHLFDKLR